MKIGLVCPYDIFGGGGVQECVKELCQELNKRGHDAKIITPRPSDVDKNTIKKNIIFIGRARPVKAAYTSNQVSLSLTNEEIGSILDKERFDILHFHEPWIPMLSMQIMSRSNSVHVATFHAAMSERLTLKTIEKIITPYTKSIFKYIDIMTAVSPVASKYVTSLTDRTVELIPNGIDTSKFKPNLNKENKTKTIFYVGRLEKRKGLKHLLLAFKILIDKDPNYQLLIGGTGPELEKLESIVSRKNIKNIKFLGYIPDSDKIKYLRNSDLYCSPAIHGESFGIVLLESMATGCVAVVGNNAGYSSVMKDFGQLSLINPKNHEEFASRMELLTTNKPLRKLWQDWAYNEVKNYDYKKIVEMYEKVYIKAYNEHEK